MTDTALRVVAAAPAALARRLGNGWWETITIALLAGALRLVRIGFPSGKVFDEHYYVPEAGELLRYKVEWDTAKGAADFVVHPPLGKWCIALGVLLFGDNPIGWRVPAVVAGVVSIIILMRLTWAMFGSMVLAAIAGLLMALDGLHFVLSRTGILDIFLMMFVLAAFACVVRSRDASKPLYWQLGAGVLCGMAMAVKWSAVCYLVAFGLLLLFWRRARYWSLPYWTVAALAYLASWSGWFATSHGWRRHWLAQQGLAEPPVLGPLLNLLRYHADVLAMHVGLDSAHPYQSQPWEWLVMARPVLFWWSNTGPCGAPACDNEIMLLGTPLLWWSFLPAVVAMLWLTIRRRDWRGWAILSGIVVGLVPWLPLPARTKYLFYALPMEPFFILAVVLVLGALIHRATREQRINGLIISVGYAVAVALCFAYYYPLYTAMRLTHEQWWARLWWVGESWI